MSEEKTPGAATARPGRRTPLVIAAVTIVAAIGITASLGLGGNDDKPAGSGSAVAEVSGGSDSTKAATVLDRPFTKPALVLTDTKGEKYDLRERTKGKPTLIYFGYTHCPDVCPMTMSNIAIARKQLPKADQDKLQVVFVTTDPERDTSAELAKWLPAAGGPPSPVSPASSPPSRRGPGRSASASTRRRRRRTARSSPCTEPR